ncbi:FCS-Like Zinc finger 15-like [Salvia hispanica]|uniref:FCS-Like Zinc finger 15-like n=1 Tax=Salvia hispanica TaxID=49212 RepID=UPI00200969BC|nr:FCS-Like Zinc finger 15-like [Salvia hispanica]
MPIKRNLSVATAAPVKLIKTAHAPPRNSGFLERCHYCNKRIAKNSDVFMYSDLCAFCSVECRDRQISLDKLGGSN